MHPRLSASPTRKRKRPVFCSFAPGNNDHMVMSPKMHTVGYNSATKKEEIPALATTRMDREGITVNGISQTEDDKCYMMSLIRVT